MAEEIEQNTPEELDVDSTSTEQGDGGGAENSEQESNNKQDSEEKKDSEQKPDGNNQDENQEESEDESDSEDENQEGTPCMLLNPDNRGWRDNFRYATINLEKAEDRHSYEVKYLYRTPDGDIEETSILERHWALTIGEWIYIEGVVRNEEGDEIKLGHDIGAVIEDFVFRTNEDKQKVYEVRVKCKIWHGGMLGKEMIVDVPVNSILGRAPNGIYFEETPKYHVAVVYFKDTEKSVEEETGMQGRGYLMDSNGSYSIVSSDAIYSFGDIVNLSPDSKHQPFTEGVIIDRYIASPSTKSNQKFDSKSAFVWVALREDLWSWVDIDEIESFGKTEKFNSLSFQIVEEIVSDFQNRGAWQKTNSENEVSNLDLMFFVWAHFSEKVGKVLQKIVRYNGKTIGEINKGKSGDDLIELNQLKQLDRQLAKMILFEIQNNNYYFNPETAYGALLYDTLKAIGAFDVVNTDVYNNANELIASIHRQDKTIWLKWIGISSDSRDFGYKFVNEIQFGEAKKIIKFAEWQHNRAEKIEALYSIIFSLQNAVKEKDRVKNPDFNNEFAVTYLEQLKALENAI